MRPRTMSSQPGRALVRHAEADGALVLVGVPVGEQLAGDVLVASEAVELERDLAVPVEAEPGERLLDLRDRVLDLAAHVRVLDAQQELAALVTGVEPVEERGADAPDVEEAGGAGSEADSDGHGSLG